MKNLLRADYERGDRGILLYTVLMYSVEGLEPGPLMKFFFNL